jgi:hypothetical protein
MDIMCNWLHQQQVEKMWSTNAEEEGVMLKRAKGDYTCCPEDLRSNPEGFFEAVLNLNVKVSDCSGLHNSSSLTA